VDEGYLVVVVAIGNGPVLSGCLRHGPWQPKLYRRFPLG